MKILTTLSLALLATVFALPDAAFARGFGGGGMRGGGGGGGMRMGGGGGGMARPNMGGGGMSRPNMGGGGGGRPSGNFANRTPSFSHPTGGGSARPGGGNFSGGNRPNLSGGNRPSTLPGSANRPNLGSGNRPSTLPGNANRPNLGSGNRPNIGSGNRPNIGGGNRPSTLPGLANRPGGGNFGQGGNRPNFGGNNNNIGSGNRVGNNNFNNIHNNINIASNRPYNNWHNGNWNGNWNHGGSGYWNGWAHGYANGFYRGGWGGYWHGGWGGYWGRPWYAYPIAWGLGAWAVGSVIYNSGYASYSNPYYGGGASSDYYDYSQPITVINQQADGSATSAATADGSSGATDPAPQPPEVQTGVSHTDLARKAFKANDYSMAGKEVDLAIQSLPRDAALHEFRALIFFATRDYKQAAATLYAVLSAGPGWDWTTLSGFYDSTETYTRQLRSLEEFVKANPNSAEARFVLAYQYLTCTHTEAAKAQYQEVLKLQPSDGLSKQMLQLLGDNPSDKEGNPPPDAELKDGEEPTAPAEIDAKKIIGKWTAKRPDGTTFSLELTDDAKFTWGYAHGKMKQEFSGKYSVDGAILVLERTDGSQMPGLVTLSNGGFNFKLYGGPPDDTGLDFKK